MEFFVKLFKGKIFSNKKITIFLIVFFFAFLLSIEVFGRLGGGGGYSSGGSRGSSWGGSSSFSGGSSWGGLSSSYRSSRNWTAQDILFALILGALILGGSFFTEKFSIPKKIKTRKLRKGFSKHEDHRIKAVLNAIKFDDLNFDIHKFYYQMKLTFVKMQWAMANDKLDSCRHFFSDGMFERIKLLEQLYEQCYLHNHIENIVVNDIKVIDAMRADGYERLDLKIDAAARDYFVDARNKRFLCGDKKQQEFTEVWTLLRCGGVKTNKDNEGLYTKHCPHCGNELELIDEVVCSFCKVRVNTGQYDWVLTEITQYEEWLKQKNVSIFSLNELKKVDPSFNLACVEDKISVIFWRNIAARMLADIKVVSRFAAPHFIEKYKDIYKKELNGTREFYMDVAVGAVELREVALDCEDDYDRIRAKIKWSCRIMNTKLPKLIKPDFDKCKHYEIDMILKRKVGVKSPAVNSLTSNVCPNCGAGEGKQYLPYCEYCRLPLNDGSRDWVLDDITVFDDYCNYGAMRKKYGKKRRENKSRKKVQYVDDKAINDFITGDLSSFLWVNDAQNLNSSTDIKNALINENVNNSSNQSNEVHETYVNNNKEIVADNSGTSCYENNDYNLMDINTEAVLLCAIAVMYADGEVDDREYQTLLAMGKSMNYGRKNIDYLIDYAIKGECSINPPKSDYEIEELIKAMSVMAMADGCVTKDERKLIYELGEDVGKSKQEIKAIIRKVEKQLLQQIANL